MRRSLPPVSSFSSLLRPLVLLVLVGLLGAGRVCGQTDSLATIGRRFERYSQRTPTEKLFLHLDRPSYVSGETIWLKIYAVEGTTQQPLAASTVAYVEVLDAQQKPVLQAKISLQNASGHGSLVLPAELASGRYTVRAYTSWMQNFGPEFYFQQAIAVLNTRQPLGQPATKLPTTYDARFFPEGGYLVQGLASKVGFKLTDNTGHGLDAEGTVLDPSGTVVARFKTLNFGLGSFSFTPTKAGTAYKAVIKLANQQTITQALPAVREQGYVLHLEEAGPEQLRLTVQTQGAALATESLYLLGHARQKVAVATVGQLQAGRAEFMVPKQQLAAGVAHFTLFNSQRQPVCERLYFQAPAPPLSLTIQTSKPQYAAREQVNLQLTAASLQPANLSVAVYQLDSLSAGGGPDISSYLWLSADVKGTIEHPDYYLNNANVAAADNLMLTQGWSRFSWAEVLATQPSALPYPPELHGHLLHGRVTDARTGAPAGGRPVYVAAPSRRIRLYSAMSQANGNLWLEVPDWLGPQQLVAQTDTLCQLEILSPFSKQYAPALTGPLTLSERVAASLLRRHVQAEVQQRFSQPADAAHYSVQSTDSMAFYGRPNEQYILDEYTRFGTLEDILREYVPGVLVRNRKDGYHLLVPDNNTRTVMDNPLVLLDGVPIFNTNRLMAFDPLKLRRLDVVMSHYVGGPLTYNGIVGFSTYKADLAGFPLDAHALLQEYEGLQGQREFYAPRYDTPSQKQSRLPDFRNLLYWNPEVVSNSKLSFYTSDQVGKYRVVVQGLTPDRMTGSASFTFEVKGAL